VESTAQVQTQKDFLSSIGLSTMSRFVNSGFNLEALRPQNSSKQDVDLRTNALLRHEEWKFIDDRLVGIMRDRLAGVADLQAAGLERNLGDLGVTSHTYEQISDMTAATSHMNPAAFGQFDTADFSEQVLPVPITSKGFTIDIRRLLASRKRGASLDTAQIETCTRLVIDKLEDMLFNGDTAITVGGNAVTGYTTDSNRATYSGSTWATVGNIDTDARGMINALEAQNAFGPYMLYVHKNQFHEMRAPIDATNQITAYDRVSARPEIMGVKASQALSDGVAVMVQLTSDVIELGSVAPIQTIQWEEFSGLVVHFLVMAGLVPITKSDHAGNSGICHATGI